MMLFVVKRGNEDLVLIINVSPSHAVCLSSSVLPLEVRLSSCFRCVFGHSAYAVHSLRQHCTVPSAAIVDLPVKLQDF